MEKVNNWISLTFKPDHEIGPTKWTRISINPNNFLGSHEEFGGHAVGLCLDGRIVYFQESYTEVVGLLDGE